MPARPDLRTFDADAVADLEARMWRSYYNRQRLRLFGQLVALLHRQFRLPWWRAPIPAAQAAIAAARFQPEHDRAGYARALPYLERFYRTVVGMRPDAAGPAELARLELEWWIAHREAGGEPSPELEHTLSDLAAALYRTPPAEVAEHARVRADAMLLRDRQGNASGDVDWPEITAMLRSSWRSLHDAVRRR